MPFFVTCTLYNVHVHCTGYFRVFSVLNCSFLEPYIRVQCTVPTFKIITMHSRIVGFKFVQYVPKFFLCINSLINFCHIRFQYDLIVLNISKTITSLYSRQLVLAILNMSLIVNVSPPPPHGCVLRDAYPRLSSPPPPPSPLHLPHVCKVVP